METKSQKKIRELLKIEFSIPEVAEYEYNDMDVIEWRLKGHLDGMLHRDFGPAIATEDGSYQEWFRYGDRHREDGPAIINGKGKQYWVENAKLSEQEFLLYQKNELFIWELKSKKN